ncbi:hypothetical protein Bca52824_027835 [Brassica carinata]|uniref:FKB95-like N-terminal Kelch domain-containing protein n=1 Tax=Brassica carinata TaxID=52824 RepID=A0A8X7VB68_BRACI|nr:hypothetical protein Bca52824_027835 [Brassica carinata]
MPARYRCRGRKAAGAYDFIDRQWRKVKGLRGRLPISSKNDHYRLADYGGKLVFLWEEHVHTKNVQNTTLVWCAEISFERCQRTVICGTVEWCDVVFTYTKQDGKNSSMLSLRQKHVKTGTIHETKKGKLKQGLEYE